MGWRFRKSINVGGGMRINISNSGVGFSYGIPGFRQSIMPNGRVRTTCTIPGTGLSYVEEQKIGAQQTEQQGVYSEYDTSITGKESTEVYKKMVAECNAWMEKAHFLSRFAIIGMIGVALVWLWLAQLDGLYEWLGRSLFIVFAGICAYQGMLLDQSKVTMEYTLSKDNTEYLTMLNFVQQLASSRKLQHLYGKTDGIRSRTNAGATTNLSLKNISVSQAAPKMITTNVKCYRLNMMKNDLYFFPDVMILIENRQMCVISYKDVSVDYSTHDIIDYGQIAGDAEIIGYRWQYSNNDGSRDRRFSNNRQIPVCRNGQITMLFPNKITIHLVGSNKTAMQNATTKMKKLCDPSSGTNITQQGKQSSKVNTQKEKPATPTEQKETVEVKTNTKEPDRTVAFDQINLKKELTPLYTQLINKCKDDGIKFRKAKSPDDRDAYTCVPMFVGNNYNAGSNDSVMIVGRAVNGWDVEWSDGTDRMVSQLLNQSFDLASINDLPEQDGYYFSRSRFFLVIKEMMQKLGASNDNWSSRFAWSNLYKVAPAIDGNPSGKVQHTQRELAVQILKKEIDILKPKYIIFVTGYDFTTWSWRNNTAENTFKKEFNLQPTDAFGDYVEGYAIYNGSKIVVACRPEMKSVTAWVDGVLTALKKIN